MYCPILMVGMSLIGEAMLSIHCIPNLHRCITTTRCDALAIRRPSQRMDQLSMTGIGEDISSIYSIPHLYHSVSASRSDVFSARRPCYFKHRTQQFVRMFQEGKDMLASGHIPYLYSL